MTASGRSYDDPCGVARALDVIGDRWALLVVRELSLGPRRFGQLRSGLGDISPNVLSQRLTDLEAHGIVRKFTLDPPASTVVYELTERGLALDPVLQELGRWGSREPVAATRELSAVSFLRSLRVLVDPQASDATFGLRLDGEPYEVTVLGGRLEVTRRPAADPVATLTGDVTVLRQIVVGEITLEDAEASGTIEVSGNRRDAAKFTRSFRIPPT